jgi:hypothetical protein
MFPLLVDQLTALRQLSRRVSFLNISMRRMRLNSVSRRALWKETATMKAHSPLVNEPPDWMAVLDCGSCLSESGLAKKEKEATFV